MQSTAKFLRKNLTILLLLALLAIAQLFVLPSIQNATIVLLINILIISPIAYLAVFGNKHDHQKSFVNLCIYGTPVIALACIALFIIKPNTADWLAEEDFIIESLSAVATILASVLLLACAFMFFARKSTTRGIAAIIIALSFFVIGMEEISWGQRILGIESSEFFIENNMQGETNLHNLNSMLAMAIFYAIVFVVFVIVPFYRSAVSKLLHKVGLENLTIFIPSLWIIPVMAIAYSFNVYTEPYYIFILTFFLFSLTYFLISKDSEIFQYRFGIVLTILVSTIVLLTFAFFDFEANGIRYWLPSEYREFFICVAIAAYAIDLLFRVKKDRSSKWTTKA